MKNFCPKCQSLFEGKTYGKDKLCGDCAETLKRLKLPIVAEIGDIAKKDPSKKKKKKKK